MSHRKPTRYEEKIDEIVTAQADDNSAWESSLFVLSLKKPTSEVNHMTLQQQTPKTLEEWAGATHPNLTLVFTDIVESTKIGVTLGDNDWIEDLFVHFSRAREFAARHKGYVVKSIGDAVMVAFRNAPDAILFALDFSIDTGVEYISIRVGINSGFVQIRENDIYGLNVNFTSRIQHKLEKWGIYVSDVDKKDFEKAFGRRSSEICWFRQKDREIKDFGNRTLWWVMSPTLREAIKEQIRARKRLLTPITSTS